MAAHTATVVQDEQKTTVHFDGKITLPPGRVEVHEIAGSGDVVLSVQPLNDENPWLALFDAMDRAPRDENWNAFVQVMKERPMNRLPVDRNLFGRDK